MNQIELLTSYPYQPNFAAMATEYNSPLYRDFPSTSKLTREDLEELLGSSRQAGRTPSGGEDTATAEQEAYFEAFVDSLPEVRQLFDEHARLLKENEEKASELNRSTMDSRSGFRQTDLCSSPILVQPAIFHYKPNWKDSGQKLNNSMIELSQLKRNGLR